MKKKLIGFLILISLAEISTGQIKDPREQKSPKQKYIQVEAQRRLYNGGNVKYATYEPFETRTIELLAGYTPPKKLPALSKYGGLPEHRVEATGFFHVTKIGDRWWGVDPEGYLYINVALNSISMGKSDRNQKAVETKFGSSEKWISQTIEILEENGFNCAGSWSDAEAIISANKTAKHPFAYTINWNFMSTYGKERGGTYQQPGHTGYPNDAIFVFDPEFETFCDRQAKKLLATKDDPNLFGHFSDNEMPFKSKSLDNFLALPESEPGHKASVKWMQEQGISKEQITDKHREAFMALVGEKYFSVVSKAIKKYDPNHMYIGARFYSEEKNHAEFMIAAGKYLDIISNNYYNYWTPDSTQMANWTAWTGKPFIVTEYYTKGEDSGMPNQSGAGWIVRTQRDRGLFYQNYNLALLESKNCVGWHYFKYQDNDPTAKGVDPSNIDANKGIVNNDYELWTPMTTLMKELNTQVYSLINYFDKTKK
ncbi:MAG: agarase [Bacteroidia bacterium]|nr:agarase [Bacteroidia bacterium]